MATPSESSPRSPVEDGKLPRHVAIIMDGNNRWAKAHQENGIAGHRAGAATARRVVDHCARLGVGYLTLFVFSSENWQRPRREVNALMALFLNVLRRQEVQRLHEHGIRLRFIGSRERFSPKLLKHMEEAEALTAANAGLQVIVAADYGGRWDIANAARRIAREVEAGKLKAGEVDETLMQRHIALGELPMPDLCIRTGGEQRISNFLLWQFAYTELYFTEVYWPDFDESELERALRDYARRQRRFGKISEQLEGS